MDSPTIFDRQARRLQRSRMLDQSEEDRWILAHMADDLLSRLQGVRRDFAHALIIGCDFGLLAPHLTSSGMRLTRCDASPVLARKYGGVVCDEDRLPFADGAFDLVVSLGVLDTVDDLPGALLLARRVLAPDGLFLAALSGAGGLPTLRQIFGNTGAARFHPQIDARSGGDLLARAGFVLPVAEIDTVTARYRTIDRLFGDLRANGLRNTLNERHRLSRSGFDKAVSDLPEPLSERFSILTLTGWTKSPP